MDFNLTNVSGVKRVAERRKKNQVQVQDFFELFQRIWVKWVQHVSQAPGWDLTAPAGKKSSLDSSKFVRLSGKGLEDVRKYNSASIVIENRLVFVLRINDCASSITGTFRHSLSVRFLCRDFSNSTIKARHDGQTFLTYFSHLGARTCVSICSAIRLLS